MTYHGSENKIWMVEIGKNDKFTIPVERGKLCIAVKSIIFTKHDVTPYNMCVLCVHHVHMDNSTVYMSQGHVFNQLCVYSTQPDMINNIIDFSDRMEFHVADFTHSDTMTLDLRDVKGRKVNGEGLIVFVIRAL